MPERFEIYIVYIRRYINTLPFLSFSYYSHLIGLTYFPQMRRGHAGVYDIPHGTLSLDVSHLPARGHWPLRKASVSGHMQIQM